MAEPTRQPLLHWLLQRHPDTPIKRAKQWILAGRVTVHGVVLRRPQEVILDPGDALELGGRQSTTLACESGWRIHPRVSLLHLDSALAVVNKGAGLISVPAPNAPLSALSILEDFLAGRLKVQDRSVAARSLPPVYRQLQPLPVHRLDQHTSGVFCMAMNPGARQRLIDQLKVHTMQREYVAFVEGRSGRPRGTWRNWLQPSRDELSQRVLAGRPSPGGGSEAQEAITHFEVVAEYPLAGSSRVLSKLRFRLETGRKHQIRAQAAHAGLPLVGDRTYNPSCRGAEGREALVSFPRQALHAEVLSLDHPDEPGRRMSWTAEWPADLRQFEAALRAALP